MAYEVIKRIGGREYRYRVERQRDPQTGKARNHWTYIGRVAGNEIPAPSRLPRPNARLRLLDAAESLLAAGDTSAVTVDAIASAAGVAHGTFYRYFRDRSDALESLARHITATRKIPDDQLLCDAVASPEAARHGVRNWVVDRLSGARERRTSLRSWYALVASDERLHAYREERRGATMQRLTEHLTVLAQRGYADIVDPPATAVVLFALFEGVIRATLLESETLDDARIAAVADAVERAIFGRV